MKIDAFSKTYSGRTVLQFPGGEFSPGSIYAILGPNGCGKSTFASVISGIIPSDQDRPAFDGANLLTGFLPQRPFAFHMNVKKNLLLNGEGSSSAQKARASHLMDALSLTALASKSAASLSGGETAKMALARLLMKHYDLLILDEPCASMDIVSIRQSEDLILEYMRETGCILFLITHSFRQAERLAQEVLFFKDGRLLERGPADQVLKAPVHREVTEILEF